MIPQPSLLVFVKYPEPGRVKTRLAQTVGIEQAAAMYREWIRTVFGRLQPLRPAIRVIAYFDGASHDAFQDWHSLADDWWPQPIGDLGIRLSRGIAAALDFGGPVLALGTDCLEIGPDLISQAFATLSYIDVVFGPTWDGGYYLVGTAKPRPGLFQSVRWSSPFTLDNHLRRCREEGWSVGLLPKLHDIDTWDDWQAWLRRAGRSHGEGEPDAGCRHPHAE